MSNGIEVNPKKAFSLGLRDQKTVIFNYVCVVSYN